MAFLNDLTGTVSAVWQLGLNGLRLRSNAGAIEARSADNSALAPFLASQVRASSVSTHGVRQTVLAGSRDSAGQPNALSVGAGLTVTLSASVSNPFVLSFAAGFDSDCGCIDHVRSFTSNQTFTLAANAGFIALYVERHTVTGALTLGAVNLGYTYSTIAPATPGVGQHWFNTGTFIMNVWSGSVWNPVQRVIVGECATNATNVTSLITYGYRGFYQSGWVPVVANTLYNFNHNLGYQLSNGALMSVYSSVAGSEGDAVIAHPALQAGAAYYGYQPYNGGLSSWKGLQLRTVDFPVLDVAGAWKTTGFYRVIVERRL